MALGSWRFILAFLVAISHLWQNMIHGPAAYAVWGFFLISGYLMTFVMQTKYHQGAIGLRNYAVNRFLRIFPAYFIVCLLGYFTLKILPGYGILPSALNPAFFMPEGWKDWLVNLTLLPIWPVGHWLVPVAGALSTEVGVYLLIPLIAPSRHAAWLGLIFSAYINLQLGIEPAQFAVRYSQFHTCFMAFCFGGLVCHYRAQLKPFAAPRLSSFIWVVHCLIWLKWDSWPWTWGLYASLPLTAWVLISFFERKAAPWDRWLGDLSYPIYLLHTVVGIWFFGWADQQRSFLFFAVSIVTTLLLSALIVVGVDRKIDRFKQYDVKVK